MSLGTTTKIAYGKASTWGTAVTLSTGERRPFIRSSINPQRGMIPDESLLGVATQNPEDTGDLDAQGTIEWHADFRQHELMWALILGTAGAPTEVEASVAYLHVLKFAATTVGLFATYGQDDGVEAFELAGFKPSLLVFRSDIGGGARETLTPVAGALDEDSVSSAAWTFTTDPSEDGARLIKHRQGVLRCNAQGGSALGSSDIIYPRLAEISISRNLESVPGLNDNVEPVPAAGNWGEVRVVWEFDEFTAAHLALFYDAMRDQTLLKADHLFTGPDLPSTGASNKFQRNFYFPALRVVESPREISGPGKLPARVVLTAHKADSDPSGFPTGYQQELVVQIQNAENLDYLA